MIVYFNRGYCDINKLDTISLKISEMNDMSIYTISVDEDGIFTDFEGQKVKVKVGDVIYIKDKQLCTSKKLDKLVLNTFPTNLSNKLQEGIDYGKCTTIN